MSKFCSICGKGPSSGMSIVRRGMAKRLGGVGKKIVRSTKRRFLPNLKKVRVRIGKTTKNIVVCTKCIKSDRITRG
ncbi:MAG: 50S ribosomal protein L28 [Candidatus Omnitrophica bacterium]|nr:50S ribosomal protein L28 [Candidatus Omnitrophota bacterium]